MRKSALLLLVVVAASSCTVIGESERTDRGSPAGGERRRGQEVRVTRDTARGPEACHPGEVGRLVVEFFDAVNRGRVNRIADFFTRKVGWYSVTEWSRETGKRHFVAYKPSKLLRYFEGRVAQNERLYLLEIDVDYERPGNLGHVAYVVARTGDDLAPYGDTAVGKGAIDCGTGRIAVWSMSHDARFNEDSTGLCPGDPEPPRIGLACARA